MANYSSSSPYSLTAEGVESLGILNKSLFAFDPDDLLYEIDTFYERRPDLLAHDLYGDSKLWWVFMHRNMDVLSDNIWSFTAGTEIRIPKKPTLEKFLGV